MQAAVRGRAEFRQALVVGFEQFLLCSGNRRNKQTKPPIRGRLISWGTFSPGFGTNKNRLPACARFAGG